MPTPNRNRPGKRRPATPKISRRTLPVKRSTIPLLNACPTRRIAPVRLSTTRCNGGCNGGCNVCTGCDACGGGGCNECKYYYEHHPTETVPTMCANGILAGCTVDGPVHPTHCPCGPCQLISRRSGTYHGHIAMSQPPASRSFAKELADRLDHINTRRANIMQKLTKP